MPQVQSERSEHGAVAAWTQYATTQYATTQYAEAINFYKSGAEEAAGYYRGAGNDR